MSRPARSRGCRIGVGLLLTVLLAGCSGTSPPAPVPSPLPGFPPQQVMQQGNYNAFLAANRRTVQNCRGDGACDVALFNLGFVHAYPLSPYRDTAKALQYFGDLIKKYPQSPWAFQGRAWVALLNEIRTRETTIRSMQTQLDRARDIDIEIDKKERELAR